MPRKKAPHGKTRREKLFVIPATPAGWREYAGLFESRKLVAPPPSTDIVLVADARGLVCGVSLYPSSGPYVFVEHLASNPQRPLRLRHRGVSLLAALVRSYCAIHSKYPVVVVRSRGLCKMLGRLGYETQVAVVMTAKPILEVP